MTWSRVYNRSLHIGHKFETLDALIFFGNHNGSLAKLKETFPKYEFRLIEQVHGTHIVNSSVDVVKADGHYTSEQNLALVIQTADCLPLMLEAKNKITALHAGWRGVKRKILPLSLQDFIGEKLKLFIGPHICGASFEVDFKTMRLIEKSSTTSICSIYPHPHPHKWNVDLQKAVRSQYQLSFIAGSIESFAPDTLTNLDYYSYRRDKNKRGRNFSFIVKTS